MLSVDLKPYRDELVISTKAGYEMWPGPYGEWGSRKYLLASLDQSLARMGLDYVDIFYSHRVDPGTPLEETMGALGTAVRSGRALYVGISSYNSERTRQAAAILGELGTPLLISQPSYSMINRGSNTTGCSTRWSRSGLGVSPSHPWPRACSPTATSTLCPPARGLRPAGQWAARCSPKTASTACEPSTTWRHNAARASPNWPSRGHHVTRA
jgi:aryl-alcohol dehydrogenase-like predicted oxidoreductase